MIFLPKLKEALRKNKWASVKYKKDINDNNPPKKNGKNVFGRTWEGGGSPDSFLKDSLRFPVLS